MRSRQRTTPKPSGSGKTLSASGPSGPVPEEGEVLVRVRAALVLLRAGHGRALVEAIDHAVAIGVDVGAAVVDLGAGLLRALVQAIDDAVLVGVDVGAAVQLLDAGLVRALVVLVGDAVVVRVGVTGIAGSVMPMT